MQGSSSSTSSFYADRLLRPRQALGSDQNHTFGRDLAI